MRGALFFFVAVACAVETPYLLSAPWTPFFENGTIHYAQVAGQVALAKKMGVTHLWSSGGMAQWDQLTIEERKAIAPLYVDECRKAGIYSIVHVGHQCISYARELARHAVTIGADSIAVIPPFAPERPKTVEELLVILELIAAEAPSLPMFYYHIPGTTNLHISISELLTKAVGRIPTLSGVKYVDSDLEDFERCATLTSCAFEKGCDRDQHYYLFWAPEPKLQALPFGAKGFTLAESYLAPETAAVYTAWKNGNFTAAQEAQDWLSQIRAVIGGYSGAGRYVTTMLGVDLGPPRLPAHGISSTAYDALEQELRNLGFLD